MKNNLLLSTICLVSMVLVFMLATIFLHELIRYENLQLNIHVLEDCKIDQGELNEVKF